MSVELDWRVDGKNEENCAFGFISITFIDSDEKLSLPTSLQKLPCNASWEDNEWASIKPYSPLISTVPLPALFLNWCFNLSKDEPTYAPTTANLPGHCHRSRDGSGGYLEGLLG